MYADKGRHAVDNPIAPGDKVLVKDNKSFRKLNANFETERNCSNKGGTRGPLSFQLKM